MGSSRFPGKPMEKILGIPMIGHVYYRSKMSNILEDVYVATCDKEICHYINSLGGECVMTKNTHERATDRTSEAFVKILNKSSKNIDSVLMIQGDEPLLNPKLLDKMVYFHNNQKISYITNLISKIHEYSEFNNPNVVKVVNNNNNNILYMSRSSIPSNSKYDGKLPMWKQLGLILFNKDALLNYINLDATELEIIESIDMNRVLENNYRITAFKTNEISHAVDNKEDIKFVEKLMLKDKLIKSYLR